MRKFIVLFVLSFFLGCTSVEQLEKQWLGRDQNTLIAIKGVPDKVLSDGFGGQIYAYSTYSTYPDTYGTYYRPYYSSTHYDYRAGYGYYHRQVITRTGETMFWIGPGGKIYKVSVAH